MIKKVVAIDGAIAELRKHRGDCYSLTVVSRLIKHNRWGTKEEIEKDLEVWTRTGRLPESTAPSWWHNLNKEDKIMQRCGNQYGIFVDGKWKWGLSYQEAAYQESEALWTKVQRKLAAGGTVILTADMAAKIEQAKQPSR